MFENTYLHNFYSSTQNYQKRLSNTYIYAKKCDDLITWKNLRKYMRYIYLINSGDVFSDDLILYGQLSLNMTASWVQTAFLSKSYPTTTFRSSYIFLTCHLPAASLVWSTSLMQLHNEIQLILWEPIICIRYIYRTCKSCQKKPINHLLYSIHL